MHELLGVAPVLHDRTTFLLLLFGTLLRDLMKLKFEVLLAQVLLIESFGLILLIFFPPSDLPCRISAFHRLHLELCCVLPHDHECFLLGVLH